MLKQEKKKPNRNPFVKNKSVQDKKEKTVENNANINEPESKDSKEKIGKDDIQQQLLFEKERLLRLSAEFENYKKRKQREINDFKKFANETVFKQFLTIADSLERAISSDQENFKKKEESLLDGMKLIHKQIMQLFETFSVKQVEAENKHFDPSFHQAVTGEPTDDLPENTIIRVLQKGYFFHDRLIRPAMVVVSQSKKNK